MPFGLGKSDKQSEHESDPANDEALEATQDTDTADSEGSDPIPADQPEPSVQPQEDAPRVMAFRPTFLDSDAPEERATVTPPPQGDAFFVSVSRDSGTETHRFDDPSQAQAFVEQLLEEGVPQEELTAFSGRQVILRITHRPIVKLVTSQND